LFMFMAHSILISAQTLSPPECGAACITSALSVTPCSAWDTLCLCTNSAYISAAVSCISQSCDATDAQNSYEYLTYLCSSVGVT
ncbi:hypothetical protein EDD21DRAFT_292940, partial [Dissophora ornata]